MTTFCIIKADCDDGDYLYNEFEVSFDEIEQLRNAITIIKSLSQIHKGNWNHYNWFTIDESKQDPYSMYVESGLMNEDLYDFLVSCVPFGEYGIHIIESIRIYELVEDMYDNTLYY